MKTIKTYARNAVIMICLFSGVIMSGIEDKLENDANKHLSAMSQY